MRRTTIALLLVAFFAPDAWAGSLGRLFFTPEQRAQIEYRHAHDTSAEGNSPSVLMINGIVRKHGGARTVWINGVAQSAGSDTGQASHIQTVTVPGKTQSVKIKVGQKLLLDESAPDEGWEQNR